MTEKEKELIEQIKVEYEYYKNMNSIEKAMYIGMYVKGKIKNLEISS